MTRTLQRAACLAAVLLGGCNQRVAVVETPVSPSPSQSSPPVNAVQPALASVVVSPSGVEAGESATGMITLAGPALSPGVFVSLSSNGESVSVPPEVGILAGTTFARFAVNTRRFENDHDRVATITASTATGSVSTKLETWAIGAPTYIKIGGEKGEPIMDGELRRFVPGTSTISAVCVGNEMRISVAAPGSESWSLRFKAPGNYPLEERWYAVGPDDEEYDYFAEMDVRGRGRSCGTLSGEFLINILDLRNNRINLFDAQFTQWCDDAAQPLVGVLRLENMPNGSASNCLR